MKKRPDLGELVKELNIEDMIPKEVTPDQRMVLNRVYDAVMAKSLGGSGISGALYLALGVAGPFSQDQINTAGVNSTFENGLNQTKTPTTGDVCAWHSNRLLYVQDGFYTGTLRHLGVVLGSRGKGHYVAHQFLGTMQIESLDGATQRVDERAKNEFQGLHNRGVYNGVLAIKYHHLTSVLESRTAFLKR